MEDNLPTSDKPMQIFKVHKSRWFLVGPMAVFFLVGLGLIGVFLNISNGLDLSYGAIGLVILVIVFCICIIAFIILMDWYSTYYILTESTIEVIEGFITHQKKYISLHDLSRVEGHAGIIGQLLNYGTITLESETSERTVILHGVSSPDSVIDLIRHSRAHVANSDK
ncbi:MAG: PH domain-containing protein [Patescibacteria group bacterium]